MSAVTVRNLAPEVHRALKVRAAQNGRSTEAEIRLILEQAVAPREHARTGTRLAAFGKRFGGISIDTQCKDERPRSAPFL